MGDKINIYLIKPERDHVSRLGFMLPRSICRFTSEGQYGKIVGKKGIFLQEKGKIQQQCSRLSTWIMQTEKEVFDKMVQEKSVCEIRKQLGLTQEELAGKLGVNRNTVSRWELGTSRPSAENLIALNALFEELQAPAIQEKEAAPDPIAPAAPKRWPMVVLCIGLACALLIGIISIMGIYSINQKLDLVDTAKPMEEMPRREVDASSMGQIDFAQIEP